MLRLLVLLVVIGGCFGCAIAKQDLIDWGKGLATDAAIQTAKSMETPIANQAASYTTQAGQAKENGDQLHYLLYTTLASALAGVGAIIHRHVTAPSADDIAKAVKP